MEILNVFPPGTGPQEVLNQLMARASEAFARRRVEYEAIETAAQLRAYQQKRLRFFLEKLGGFPRRGALEARTVGRISGKDFRIEKVIFESQPRHLVTGNLYLPAGKGPHPAVLIPCGHNDEGKAADRHQRLCMLLATSGLAAFCYDPISQGERYQFLTEKGTRRYWPTLEHTMLGMGCILLGTNTARYRIYDGMRALDYLQSRSDIDGSRLGCTGYSGGGTLTSYLTALDARVVCSAPCCYLASLERVIEALGPQDAEQNIHAQVAFGMEHADYLLMGAPIPALICAATRDFFPIDGVWEVFRQVKRMYARLGFSERVDLVEDDVEHDYSQILRVATTRWLRRWLLQMDGSITEPDFSVFSEEQLSCTPDGQVALVAGTRSGFAMNAEWEQRLARQRRRFWAETPPREIRREVREITGIPPLSKLPVGTCEQMETIEREGYCLEKLLIHTEEGVRIPALAFVPPRTRDDAYLYVHGEGKSIDADGPIADLVGKGHLVLAIDPRGCGELCPETTRQYDTNAFLAYLLGLSYIGMRAADILIAARLLSGYRPRKKPYRVHLVGIGAAGPAVLHAAALEPRLCASLTLRNSLISWARLVRAPEASLEFLVHAVHRALRTYDLPDLLSLLPAGKVTIEEPLDPANVKVQP